MHSDKGSLIRKASGIVFWLALWQTAAMVIDRRIILVSPIETVKRLCELAVTADFLKTVGNSFLRITLGYLLAMFSGIILAVISHKSEIARGIITPFMTAVRSVPVASFVILALFWMKSTQLSVFVTFLIVMPVIFGASAQGIASADPKLIETADVFGFSAFKRIRYLYIPAVMPYLRAACVTAAGLAFKSGAAAEVIGQPDHTLGDMLYRSKIYLETADLFAWTVVIILLSKLFEKAVVFSLGMFYKCSQRVGKINN